jgi:hypothetical protein
MSNLARIMRRTLALLLMLVLVRVLMPTLAASVKTG